MLKRTRRVHFADENLYYVKLLPEVKDAKLSQILTQQRKYHHLQKSECQASPVSSPRTQNSSFLSHDAHVTDDTASELDSSVQTVHSEHLERRQVWAAPADALPERSSLDDRQPVHANDLRLQDISNECDQRSSVSLLESESIYLPFDIPASPVAIRRPFTAPEQETGPFVKPPSDPALYASDQKRHLSRPYTATDSRHPTFTKYDSLEQRPIRPLNQHVVKGNIKPAFEVARPLTSSSEPSVSTHKDTSIPTARSQDYESSSEQTASESEVLPQKPDDNHTTQPKIINTIQLVSIHAPKDKLNHIKAIAGNKRAGHPTSRAGNPSGKSFAMKTATAASMAASAVLRNRLPKTNLSTAGAVKMNSPEGRDHLQDSVAARHGARDSKQIKGRLNMERMELEKDGRSHPGGRDAGSVSQPASDIFTSDPQQIGHKAATSIQAFWRGYWAREHNTKVVSVRKEIRARRAEDHIMLLRKDLERNRKLYEEEKRLRILQMEAIRLLYHEVQVLKSQSTTSNKDLGNTTANTSVNFSPTATGTSMVTAAPAAYSELNRTQELERTCLSLQSQVSHLQEALASVSSAVFRTNSLDSANFELTDHSDTVQVSPNFDDHQPRSRHPSEETSHWGCIPHSLSPYPSEEEEQYYLRVPMHGAPTPPRCLQLHHFSPSALLLSWQPSSCAGRLKEEEGNRHIIGYRVYVNDKLKAFICHCTSALVEGLNAATTYKFYIKALSGFGESFESNILMVKLASGPERQKYPESTDSSHDSDRDVDSSQKTEKLKPKHRKHRRSPRMDKKSSKASSHLSSNEKNVFTSPGELAQNVNCNNSTVEDSPVGIFTHPKLHTHRRNRSRDLHTEGDSFKDTLLKEPSPTAVDRKQTGQMVSPNTKNEAPRQLPESPKSGHHRLDAVVSADLKPRPTTTKNSEPDRTVNSGLNVVMSGTKKDSHWRKDSPPSGSFKTESPSHSKKTSPIASPSCGSDGDPKLKSSPKPGSEGSSLKVSSPSLMETFTVDKGSSYLESLNAITESALSGMSFGSPGSGSRGHKRTKSRDYQQASEKSATDGGSQEVTESEVSVEEAARLGSRHKERSNEGRREGDGSSDSSGKHRGHRRKRSKDLSNQGSEWRTDEAQSGGQEERREDNKSEDHGEKSEEACISNLSDGVPLPNRPVIDGRHRHSSGSRPNSPVVSVSGGEEKPRMSIAELLLEQQKVRNLKLKESGRGDQVQRLETNRRSSSIDSVSSNTFGDTSRRSPSAESLPESIREDAEQDSDQKLSQNLPTGGRRAQPIAPTREATEASQVRLSKETTAAMMSKLLHKLETITKNSAGGKKESLTLKRSNTEEKDWDLGSKPPSDDERKGRSRNLSESDAEGGPQLPPRVPSGDSSSGSHSDDSRQSRRHQHRRTPSDHWLPPSTDYTRPTHSPIIMEGALVKKHGSSVRRNQSFHGLLPSKHQDTKTSPSSNEETSPKADEQNPALSQSDTPVRSRALIRSRTPSPAGSRTPILSVAQLKRHSDGGKPFSSTPGKM
ncbi:unnamed protein product [Lymnaea stagnalis]|uniref:Fibronectin type-III domain-containing protein n=1 Tax=Lymnaea stagnalis TaxID=6523 RepID=A0AAV2ICR1_LYMST